MGRLHDGAVDGSWIGKRQLCASFMNAGGAQYSAELKEYLNLKRREK